MIISLSIEDCMLLQYADNSDLIVSDKDPSKNGQQLNKNLGCCNKWLIDNKLSLHMGKTELLLFWYKTGQDTSLSVMDKQFMLTLLFSHTYHIDQYWNALVMKWLVVSSKKVNDQNFCTDRQIFSIKIWRKYYVQLWFFDYLIIQFLLGMVVSLPE